MLEKSLQSETNRRLDGKTVVDVNREQAEAALREQAERFERLFDSTPLSYQSLSKDGSFIEVNDTWCETFGFDRKDVVGKNFSDFITEDSVRAFLYEFPCFLTEGEIHGVEFEIVTKQGDPVNVLLEGKISNNPDGTFRGTHCILQDITELKKVDQEQQTFERKLQHMQKLESLGLLAGGIAHDFNNLLMTIIGNADLALLDLPESSPARENLKEIEKASTRAAELAMQMLAYSGKAKFQRAKICLNEIVSDMSSLLKASVTKSTTFDTSLSEQVPTIYADPTQLRQVAMNLITNASEAIGENNGTITVSTGDMYCNRSYLDATSLPENQVEGIYAFLSVTDDGCGMDSDTMHKLFDPFFTTKFTGRGLGLAATVGIIRGHGGTMSVTSEIGQGTTMTALFPAVDGSPDSIPEKIVEDLDQRGTGTVLLVDDEHSIRRLGERMLEKLGFSVLTACDGEEAVIVFGDNKEDIDCVILDLAMPKMGGGEAFKRMRAIREDLPVILSSGYDEDELREQYTEKGVAGFIQKPYDFATLKKTIFDIVGTTLKP